MRLFLSVYLLGAILMSACGTFVDAKNQPRLSDNEQAIDSELIETGIQVYRENYCGICHTLTVANTHGTFGPNHDNTGATAPEYITLATYSGEATTPADYIRESIVNPDIYSTPLFEATSHRMPAFSHLSDEDLDAIVYLLINQRLSTD